LNAVSVGFIPLRWEDGGKAAGGEQSSPAPRRRYLEQELLEVSAVAIPANPDALALGLKSGAVERSDVQATVELLRGLVGTEAAQSSLQANPWFDLAREFRRVMRKA
jgi:phage head maturation protease